MRPSSNIQGLWHFSSFFQFHEALLLSCLPTTGHLDYPVYTHSPACCPDSVTPARNSWLNPILASSLRQHCCEMGLSARRWPFQQSLGQPHCTSKTNLYIKRTSTQEVVRTQLTSLKRYRHLASQILPLYKFAWLLLGVVVYPAWIPCSESHIANGTVMLSVFNYNSSIYLLGKLSSALTFHPEKMMPLRHSCVVLCTFNMYWLLSLFCSFWIGC